MNKHDTDNIIPSSSQNTPPRSLKLFTAILAVATVIMVGLVIQKAYVLLTAEPQSGSPRIDEMTFDKKDNADVKTIGQSGSLLDMVGVNGVGGVGGVGGVENGQTFKGEPANLKPLQNAKRIAGVQNRGQATLETITNWVVDNIPLDEVQTHYLNQAITSGYDVKEKIQNPDLRNIRLTKEGSILIIRLNQTDKKVRVLLWEIQNVTPQNR